MRKAKKSPRAQAKRARKPARRWHAEAQRAMRELREERGLLSKIAIGIGVKPQAVHQWDVVPLERVLEVERVTGKPRHELRPDFFHAPGSAA
jgi:uncharacterized protein (DUF2252 family)